jgi:hypothetical protein
LKVRFSQLFRIIEYQPIQHKYRDSISITFVSCIFLCFGKDIVI